MRQEEQELHRCLNSLGSEEFVQNFELFRECFQECNKISECIAKLIKKGVSEYEAGATWRCFKAKTIFDKNWECDALQSIIDSPKRMDASIKSKAKALFQKHCKKTGANKALDRLQ